MEDQNRAGAGRADGQQSGSNTKQGETVNVAPFGMNPRMITESGLSNGAHRLWCFLDGRHGDQGYDAFGLHYIADRISAQTESVSLWADELKSYGLIDIAGEGSEKRRLRLLGNPSRKGHEPKWRSEDIPPPKARHHGSRGSAAKRAEMESLGSDESKRTGPRHQCIGVRKRDGGRCKRPVKEGQFYCREHEDQDPYAVASADIFPEKQESNLPAKQEGPSRSAGTPLVLCNSYQEVVLGEGGSSSLSSVSVKEESFVSENTGGAEILANASTGEILEDASDVELPGPPVPSMSIGWHQRQNERERQLANA